ncbi:meiosis-specific with OB domain-containing protein-like [Babylonia areolata]|uniref:meiosis-specific with OB domain-containing protein-like n=1 Tax=Babylonia areolata TaxID=304850 RepID=UPI003FD0221E
MLKQTTLPGNYLECSVVGVIIAKEQQRSIFSKKNGGSERYLLSFTLRDSPSFFVNVTCWGNADFISDISSNFEVGSVVKLKNVQVQAKAGDPSDEKFKPWTPVSFQLTVSDHQSKVESYTGWDAATYRNTLSIPTRPNNDYYTLEDIGVSGMTLQGEHVNILAAVKRVGQIRYLTTKTGKETKKCDVVVFDDTTPSFCLVLKEIKALVNSSRGNQGRRGTPEPLHEDLGG